MPARIGDTRTPAKKEEDSKKAIYQILSEKFQSWGTLKKAAKKQRISTATLAKHLKNFVETGIAVKKEDPTQNQKLPRTYYRLTSEKPHYGNMTEREIYTMIKAQPTLQISEEEDEAWAKLVTATKIFAYEIAVTLAIASQKKEKIAKKFIENNLDIKIKESVRELFKIFYKFKDVKNETTPITSFATESLMIDAEDNAKSWIPEGLIKKFGGFLPDPEISIAWALLTSESTKEAIQKIEQEIQWINEQLNTQS